MRAIHRLLDGLQETTTGFQVLDVGAAPLEELPAGCRAVFALGLDLGGNEVFDEIAKESDGPAFGVDGSRHGRDFVQMVLQNLGDARDDVRDDQQRIFGCGLAM